MRQFVFLLAACFCADGFPSAVSADETQSDDAFLSITLTADEIVQENEETASAPVTDDESVNSEEDLAVPSRKQIVIRLGGNSGQACAFSTIGDDPPAKLQLNEKIVVIGPDGKHQEFAISGNEAGNVFKIVTGGEATGNDQQASPIDSIVRILKRHDATGTASDGETTAEARMAIGVQCEDVPAALRSHLDLNDKGIMIGHVREESPASEAALMKFDIIVQIGDTDVITTDDLVSSVAASDGKELSLSIIRHGQPMKVAVTPRKMEFPMLLAPAQTGLILSEGTLDTTDLDGNPAWESLPGSVKKQLEGRIAGQNSLRKFHPGIVIEQRMPSNEKDMQGLIEHARKLAEDSGRVAQTRTQKAAHGEAVDGGIEALREQVRAMEKKLEQLEKRLAAEADDKK